ncbi:MAG: hypothetical protein A2231_00060 [Candidatus Firestonebacteria bacterium RIFOXYA2_FULL_40_8]|nr:MAG: hypothetical protein A2231_00060 [Candidatus Firestonebacteria bacterium RIFOXYA2_FULL_40_8]
MKICFLGDGSSIHVKRIVEYFSKNGAEVFLISFIDPKIKRVKFYKLRTSFSFSDLNYPVNIPLLKKYLQIIKPDVLHAHYATSYGFMAACSGFKPLVVSCWGSDIFVTPRKNILFKGLTNFVLRKADYLTFDSPPVLKRMRELTIKYLRAKEIVFGVEEKYLHIKKRKNTGKVILSVRGLEPLYNVDKIIKAFALISKKNKNTRLLILGKGSMLVKLKQLTEKLGLRKSIKFYGDQPHHKLPGFLAAADVFVAVPNSDAISVSLIEAMAAGVIPVVSNIESKTCLVRDGVNGYVLEPGITVTSTGVAAKIQEALDNTVKISSIIKINKALVAKKYLFAKNMEKLRKIYKFLILESK